MCLSGRAEERDLRFEKSARRPRGGEARGPVALYIEYCLKAHDTGRCRLLYRRMLCHKQNECSSRHAQPSPGIAYTPCSSLQLYLGPRLRSKVAESQAGGTDLATLDC